MKLSTLTETLQGIAKANGMDDPDVLFATQPMEELDILSIYEADLDSNRIWVDIGWNDEED